MGFGEKVNSREQLISDAVGGVLEVCLGLSHGATQQTLKKEAKMCKTLQSTVSTSCFASPKHEVDTCTEVAVSCNNSRGRYFISRQH